MEQQPAARRAPHLVQERREGVRGWYRNGQLHGVLTRWYENGQKESEGAWRKGLQHGRQVGWYENGLKWYDSEYRNGQPYTDGNLLGEQPLKVL